MKAKLKEKNDNFKLTCTHRELVIIREALNSYSAWENTNLDRLNGQLFDRDEVKSLDDVDVIIDDVLDVINTVQEDINVY